MSLSRHKDLTPVGVLYMYMYTPYEGPNLANQENRKLVVFDRKLEESYSLYYDVLLNINE